MPFLLWAILFAIAGAVGLGKTGFLFGGILGVLVGQVSALKQRVQLLEDKQQKDTNAVSKPNVVTENASAPNPAATSLPKSNRTAWEPPKQTAKIDISQADNTNKGVVIGERVTVQPSNQKPSQPTAKTNPSILNNPLLDLVTKGNMITRVGIIVLFFGVAFLIKYASAHITVPIEFRLLGIATGAAIIFLAGWRLYQKKPRYSLLLQGAAIGIWYLTTFAAFRLYHVIPIGFGFLLLFILSLLSAGLSVARNEKLLAVFAILGGFLAPILATTGQGSHITLFAYYAVLNLGIFLISWFRSWRSLFLLGFAFTFVIGTAWGVTQYRAAYFSTTEPFLLLFILFYVTSTLLVARREGINTRNFVDAPIVFGTPVIGFSLQAALIHPFPYGLAWSAFGFGLFYLFLAWLLPRIARQGADLLRESFLGIGIVFVTLAVPYTFDNEVTTVIWAIEGAGALWFSLRQKRAWGSILALLIQFGAGASWLASKPSVGAMLFFNPGYFQAVLIAAMGLFSSGLLYFQPKNYWLRLFYMPLLGWSLAWWYLSSYWQLQYHLTPPYLLHATVLFCVASNLFYYFLRARLLWHDFRPIILVHIPAIACAALVSSTLVSHPGASLGFIAWPLFIVAFSWLLYRLHLIDGKDNHLANFHIVLGLVTTSLLMWEAWWQVGNLTQLDSWRVMFTGSVPLSLLMIVVRCRLWHVDLDSLYREKIALILISFALPMLYLGFAVAPDISPFPYIPLLNPLDIWQFGTLFCIWRWYTKTPSWHQSTDRSNLIKVLLTVTLFILINVILLRTIHILTGIDYHLSTMVEMDLVQTCLSILWTLISIAAMLYASNRSQRAIWAVGISLLAVVVLKLFLVDLTSTGTLERVISFLAVGILLLGVGYLAPIPAKTDGESKVPEGN